MQHTQQELITFLPYFLDEDIYIDLQADTQILNNKIIPQPTNDAVDNNEKSILAKPTEAQKIDSENQIPNNKKVIIPAIENSNEEKNEAKEIEKPIKIENKIITKIDQPHISTKEQKTEAILPKIKSIKVIILVSYINGIPASIEENYFKIFGALGLSKTDIEIINVTAQNPELLQNYSFEYLILMGGKGKSLSNLQSYTGKRDFLEIGKVDNSKILFADKLDTYLQTGNEDQKRAFWATLKKVFEK